MNKVIWLDDVRDPKDHGVEALWVKNFEEFQAAVRAEHPHMVHFDHDLGNEYHWNETHPMNEDGTSPDEHEILYDKFQEMTGYHAAKWLVDYCMINELPLPRWNVHSMNVVGAKNIRDYLTLAERHLFS